MLPCEAPSTCLQLQLLLPLAAEVSPLPLLLPQTPSASETAGPRQTPSPGQARLDAATADEADGTPSLAQCAAANLLASPGKSFFEMAYVCKQFDRSSRSKVVTSKEAAPAFFPIEVHDAPRRPLKGPPKFAGQEMEERKQLAQARRQVHYRRVCLMVIELARLSPDPLMQPDPKAFHRNSAVSTCVTLARIRPSSTCLCDTEPS